MLCMQDGRRLQPDDFAHLLLDNDGLCWWCQKRPATTGEHKYKHSDLKRLMGDDDVLYWGDHEQFRELRGRSGIKRDRHGVVKFPKSMCGPCNNARSQPFDLAYDRYAKYVTERPTRKIPGLDFEAVYGESWENDLLNLARYFGKHFGCRMARSRVPVPESLRSFLDGSTDMPDAHMALITTDSVHRLYRHGMYIGPDGVDVSSDCSRFTGYVMAVYLGSFGVRYMWSEEEIPNEERSQFFHFPRPLLNYFRTEEAVMRGDTRKPGLLVRFLQWAQKPRNDSGPES
ncbi:hypothetical protein BHE97_17145 [Aeromicrobium sp. PE09-221]|nr:hypothetical protein BHE97_17145 [Aeromicrobium sp. PE09-221]